MSNITNAKKYAILWLYSQGSSVKDISKELSLSESSISEIIESNKPAQQNENREVPQESVSAINSKNLMITHTAGKKTNTVAIMTKEASELNDSKFKAMPAKDSDKGIFRPKPK